jgi:Restriction endonuclease
MRVLNFNELEDHFSFQRLCGDLLLAEGCCNMRGPGTGADQGADLLVDVPTDSPLGRELVTYVVQCKWYAPHRSVRADELGDVLGFLSLQRATGLLIITTGDFSGTAVTKANSIDRDPTNPYRVKLWNGTELSRRLRRHPTLVARHWYPSRREPFPLEKVDAFPLFHAQELAEKFKVPALYKSLAIETFRETAAGSERIRSFENFAERYRKQPPVVTVIVGAVGSGKTGLAWSLLNSRPEAELVAGLAYDDVKDLICSYVFGSDESLPRLISAFIDIDFLLFDDFDYSFGQQSKLQLLACELLVEVVERRIELRRPTLLTVGDFARTPDVLRGYIERLQKSYPTIDCGDKEIRRHHGKVNTVYVGCYYFSKTWLSEKMSYIEGRLAEAIKILTLPETAFAHEVAMFEQFGIRETREERLISLLDQTLSVAIERRETIERMPWKAIRFEDGNTELEL